MKTNNLIIKALVAGLSGALLAHTSAQDNDCLQNGTMHFGQKEYKKAIMVLKKCDDTPKVQQLLGIAYYELNYMNEVTEYLKKAIASTPDNVDLQVKYASSFARNRQFKKAVEEFKTLTGKYPDNRDVRAGYAQALGWSRDYTAAIAEYSKLVKEDPKDFDSWLQIGILTSWNKRFKEAVQTFNDILAAQPPEKNEIDTRLQMAEVLSWMKKLDESIAEYDKVTALAPKDARAFLGKGQVQEWQGKYKLAIQTYEQALQAEPGNKNAQARLQQLMWVK